MGQYPWGCTSWLEEDLLAVVPFDILEHALCQPFGDGGGQGFPGSWVIFPGWVFLEDPALHWRSYFRHDEQAPNKSAGDRVQGPELWMPGVLGLYQGLDSALSDDGPALLVSRQREMKKGRS
jgi:hypothetical protein